MQVFPTALKESDTETLEEVMGTTKRFLMSSETVNSRILMNQLSRIIPPRYYKDFCAKYMEKKQRNIKVLEKYIEAILKAADDIKSYGMSEKDRNKKSITAQSRLDLKSQNNITPKSELSGDENDEIAQVNFLGIDKRPTKPCPICGQNHWLFQCRIFRHVWNRNQRLEFIEKEERCKKCFVQGHHAKQCSFERGGCLLACGPEARYHHTFLCPEFDPVNLNKNSIAKFHTVEEINSSNGIFFKNIADTFKGSLGKTNGCSLMQMVITIANPFNNQKVRVNALYDTGCNRTAVSEKIIDMWKMPCREDWLTINGTQNSSFKVRAKWTDLIFQNDNGSVSMKTNVSCIKNPIGDEYNPIEWNYHKQKFPHLKDLSFVDLEAPLDGELFPVPISTDLIDLIRLDFNTESVPQSGRN